MPVSINESDMNCEPIFTPLNNSTKNVDSLGTSEAKWWHISGSALAQVMAWSRQATKAIENRFYAIIRCHTGFSHYNDVIISAVASHITCLTIVYSTVYPRRRSKKISKLRVTGLCVWNSPVTGEFPAQKASNAKNVSIWWRHHAISSWNYRQHKITVFIVIALWYVKYFSSLKTGTVYQTFFFKTAGVYDLITDLIAFSNGIKWYGIQYWKNILDTFCKHFISLQSKTLWVNLIFNSNSNDPIKS